MVTSSKAVHGGVRRRSDVVLRHNLAARIDGAQHVRHLTEHNIMDGGKEVATIRTGYPVAIDVVRGSLIYIYIDRVTGRATG
jgi:formylmethanofuran dehydrogenase subunit B